MRITRLGSSGIPRPVYGSFAGKTPTAGIPAVYINTVSARAVCDPVPARDSVNEVTK